MQNAHFSLLALTLWYSSGLGYPMKQGSVMYSRRGHSLLIVLWHCQLTSSLFKHKHTKDTVPSSLEIKK